jgi:hypothetical protein
MSASLQAENHTRLRSDPIPQFSIDLGLLKAAASGEADTYLDEVCGQLATSTRAFGSGKIGRFQDLLRILSQAALPAAALRLMQH